MAEAKAKERVAEIFDRPVEELNPIAGQVLQSEANCFGELVITPIGRSFGIETIGIYRVTGQAHTPRGEQCWSAAVKILAKPETPEQETSHESNRELHVYRSGVFAEVCGGVRCACCYAIQEREGKILLWLEDLTDAPQTPWLARYYLQCARHIGQFNAYWPEHKLPQWSWLRQGGFEKYKQEDMRKIFEELPSRRQDRLIRRVLSPGVTRRLLNFWEESEALFAKAEKTSKGVCHLDCHPKNLFLKGHSTEESYTVAIDWMYVGAGYLGLDAGHLLVSPIKWLELDPQQARFLITPIFNAYVAGLKESGWAGDEEQVRLTYLTALACQAFRSLSEIIQMVDNPEQRAKSEENFGFPLETIFDRWVEPIHFYLDCADAAIALAKELDE